MLATTNKADLPEVCIKCGADTADGKRIPKQINAHYAWFAGAGDPFLATLSASC